MSISSGSIKRLTDKGFGFIRTESGNDLFFHSSALDGVSFEELRVGQRVEFREGQGPKGPRAETVRVVV
jgi:CspA family cold shock protein